MFMDIYKTEILSDDIFRLTFHHAWCMIAK